MNKYKNIKRRKSNRIYVGNVPIGDGAPISVQSMTNTQTTNIEETIKQIIKLKKVGVDIVRISVPTLEAAESFKIIKLNVDVPLIADIHFDYRLAIKSIKYGADCLRINPGNIGNKRRILDIVNCAKDKNIPIRIGVNAGSLENDLLKKYKSPIPEALVESAIRHIEYLDSLNFNQFKVSVKTSDVFSAIEANEILAKKTVQPIHIGITESGALRNGIVKSSIGITSLLLSGIGDTLRISLAADPVEEVKVGYDILKTLGIRFRGVNFIACPTCSRQEFNVIDVVNQLEKNLEDLSTPMNVSIIGCIVNGIGEAKVSTLGIVGGSKTSALYKDGIRQKNKLKNQEIIKELEIKIRKKAKSLDKLKKII
ncbi:flavodoxin-dependent (E)-4-hydroxy-3-methylbut-2-enyl-diphosphate synthase [Buchnera aphidicola]|jgi:(E)-4-hydroxy-3-methylbut-2-enyl-diphosphate synthase|uniref:4-hydroxy-3-methylbut-2-en-1-yl diphosphate synthase (flavodoxin) n=1 Tax=Buchnera aphidicola subsp. Schizaphis graminum (strain Sg) TaxID=198804 RepID=ISPG_BUCAP|nr:flavodoxin-dependent (E)-4-hydroxy-3-methylbut-2-enyl-diphosphate synthase [Buchnera aphidicola]Q8K9P4.1 RecName: Full=4-hydroxy-3-methylbut-2-en-1-yl diphosphate synthase (flavodoxin); AltName: Full=1-hydroxy-2-methyl-2-(E)-butenyl 4-diphosphate synthase [Buchnera aphidicola str. Sg (Schizaphis graminum)]AAM67834.1 GcpE (protein e) [Buchnera aphidicola str. Sg (Schizaphis graminum)]AWI49669.1 flavodoxin-dependent (E)-4-hydroxy-3-methylbut-2-enyl-diphosphate synthase [Buchnera aphidicola (Sch